MKGSKIIFILNNKKKRERTDRPTFKARTSLNPNYLFGHREKIRRGKMRVFCHRQEKTYEAKKKEKVLHFIGQGSV